ncbi:MAG: ABC transporter substrate-binding protein [Treponema sp.]|jgi:multiple sugar transport system substrate-binding protein|nr:ABC transporter substrate-binding protein [Treponema sp.]
MKRTVFLVAVLLAPAMIFAGGTRDSAAGGGQQASGGYIRFAWWGNTTRDERTIKAVQLFMEKNPGVTVETEPTQWDGYWPKLNTQAAAGSLPDVMQQDYSYIAQYNNRNQLVDMNSYAQKGVIDLSKWSESGLASGRLNGKLIALSLGTNAWGVCVDPAVLQQAGLTIDDTAWTWKDFEQIALTIYQKTGVQTMPIDQIPQVYEHAIRQFGLALYAKDGKSVGWASNTGIIKELLDMDLRLKTAGALYDPEDAFIVNRAFEEEPISRGKTWNSYYWSNQHTGHVNAAKRPLDYYICPSVNGNKAPYGTYLKPSQFISMLSASKSQDLAAKFVNFIVNDLEANRILLAERGIPVPSDVRADLSPRVDPGMKYLFDYITKVTPFTTPIDPPDPAAAGEVRDVIKPLALQCLTGRISSADAVAQMVQAANAVLSR